MSYGFKTRNRDHFIQIDDQYSNLVLLDHKVVDLERRPFPWPSGYNGYPLLVVDSETFSVSRGPHVIAIQPLDSGSRFAVRPRSYHPDGEITYVVSALDNADTKCRYFVFGIEETRYTGYGLRIPASGGGAAFVSNKPYMRIVQNNKISRSNTYGTIGLPSSSREYAFVSTVFSTINRTSSYDARIYGGDSYGRYQQTVARIRGLRRDADKLFYSVGDVSLIAGGTKPSSDFQATNILTIDVTGIY